MTQTSDLIGQPDSPGSVDPADSASGPAPMSNGSEGDAALRADVRRVGALLGQTIRC